MHDAECFFDIAGLCMPWNDLQTAIGAAARYVARLLPAVIADERRLRTDPFKKLGRITLIFAAMARESNR